MRVAFTDGEMTGLSADGWDQLLCAGVGQYQTPSFWKGKCIVPPWSHVNVLTFDRETYDNRRWHDLKLSQQWERKLQDYDVTVSWNGIKHDEPFLRTRLAEYGKTAKPWKRHKDLMYTARYKLKLSSASLENVCNHLRIHERYGVRKTPLNKILWRKAICGHWPSYLKVVEHCRFDIMVLAAVWHELIPWVTEIK